MGKLSKQILKGIIIIQDWFFNATVCVFAWIPPVLLRFSLKRNVLWDQLKANISRMFQIHHITLLKLLYFSCKNDAE